MFESQPASDVTEGNAIIALGIRGPAIDCVISPGRRYRCWFAWLSPASWTLESSG